jgi:hypothetical protein
MVEYNNLSTTSSYADPTASNAGYYFNFSTSKTDGTVNCYHEFYGRSSNGLAVYASLFDTSNNQVTNSEVSTTSTTNVTLTSSAFTLSDATTYKIRVKSGSGTPSINGKSFLRITQSSFTKTQTYLQFASQFRTNTAYGVANENRWVWQGGDYDTTNTYDFAATIFTSNASHTAYCDLQNVTGSEVSTTSTAPSYQIVTGLTMPANGTVLNPRTRISNAAASVTARPVLIINSTLPVTSQIKSVAGVVYASIKSLSGVAIANVKSFAGVSNV